MPHRFGIWRSSADGSASEFGGIRSSSSEAEANHAASATNNSGPAQTDNDTKNMPHPSEQGQGDTKEVVPDKVSKAKDPRRPPALPLPRSSHISSALSVTDKEAKAKARNQMIASRRVLHESGPRRIPRELMLESQSHDENSNEQSLKQSGKSKRRLLDDRK